MKHVVPAIGFALAFAALPATAQVYKCKGPDGKIVYSDTRCEASGQGALKVTPNATTPSEREAAIAEEKRAAAAAAAGSPSSGGLPVVVREVPSVGGGPYQPTSSEQERIRNLEVLAGSMGAYPEQKTAARLEISQIRSGRDARLSSDQRSRRDSLTTDLSSTDAKKRQLALKELRAVYR